MNARLIVAAAVVAVAGPALPEEENYRIDPLHTATTFSVTHLGLSQQRGSFGKTTGTVVLDRAAKKGSIDVAVDASVKRTEFGMTKNLASTADEVRIAVAVEAIQQQ